MRGAGGKTSSNAIGTYSALKRAQSLYVLRKEYRRCLLASYSCLAVRNYLYRQVKWWWGAVRRMRTRIRLLAQPKSMRSIIGATQREQPLGSA